MIRASSQVWIDKSIILVCQVKYVLTTSAVLKIICSGESGAVCLGALYSLMSDTGAGELRAALELDTGSRVLCVNTEGDTDPEGFWTSIWD